jgi:hypothetical protein
MKRGGKGEERDRIDRIDCIDHVMVSQMQQQNKHK